MGSYTDADAVRRACGVASTLISDADVNSTITNVEQRMEKFLNTTGIPRRQIDILDGNGTDTIVLPRKPLLRVVSLKIGGTAILATDLYTYLETSRITLKTGAGVSTFLRDFPQRVVIDYWFGLREKTTTQTITSNAETAGSAVAVEVASGTSFAVNDWVEIVGTDGFREITKLTAVSGNTLTADLSYNHAAVSLVTKTDVPEQMKELAAVLTGLRLVANVVGSTFDELTGYSINELQVQKGEPYTQWRETFVRLVEIRDNILQSLRPMPSIA